MLENRDLISNLSFLYSSRETNLTARIQSLRDEAESVAQELLDLEKVNEFFQGYIALKSEKTRKFIEDVVNRGLEYIFQGRIRVEVISDIKSNRVVYDLVIHDEESKVSGGRESHGGGISAVVALLFKFLANYLTHRCPLLVEDESLSDVSFHYQERLSRFIADLSKEFGYCVLLTSHQQELDKFGNYIYTLSKVNGKTVIEDKERGILDES